MTVLPPFREAFPADDLLRPPQAFAAPPPGPPPPPPQQPTVAPALDPAMQFRHQSDVFTPRNAAPPARTDDLFALHAAAMASSSGRAASSSGYSALDARHMPYDTRHRPASRSPPDAARSLAMPLPPQHPYAYASPGLAAYHAPPPAAYQPPPRVSHPHSSSRSTSQSASASPDSDANPSRFIILRPAGFDGGDPLDVAAYSQVSLPQAEWAMSAGRLTTDSRSHLRVQDGGGTPESDPELSEGSGAPSRARGRRVRGSDAKVLPCPWPGCNKTYTSVGNINRHVRTVHGNHPPPR